MANDGGGNSAGGTSSGLGGLLGKTTAVVLGATALIVALETFLEKGQSFTCSLGVALPWCEQVPSGNWRDNPLSEYLEKQGENQ